MLLKDYIDAALFRLLLIIEEQTAIFVCVFGVVLGEFFVAEGGEAWSSSGVDPPPVLDCSAGLVTHRRPDGRRTPGRSSSQSGSACTLWYSEASY